MSEQDDTETRKQKRWDPPAGESAPPPSQEPAVDALRAHPVGPAPADTSAADQLVPSAGTTIPRGDASSPPRSGRLGVHPALAAAALGAILVGAGAGGFLIGHAAGGGAHTVAMQRGVLPAFGRTGNNGAGNTGAGTGVAGSGGVRPGYGGDPREFPGFGSGPAAGGFDDGSAPGFPQPGGADDSGGSGGTAAPAPAAPGSSL